MPKKYIILIIGFMVGTNFILSQPPVDYNHRRIVKAIARLNDQAHFEMSPMEKNDKMNYLLVMQGKYFKITGTGEGENPVSHSYVGRVNSCRASGCSIPLADNMQTSANPEYFDYFILFDNSAKILKVEVFNYQASHGQEVSSRSWLKQYNQYAGKSSLNIGKDIDAISGATISVHAINEDIMDKTKFLSQILNQNKELTTTDQK